MLRLKRKQVLLHGLSLPNGFLSLGMVAAVALADLSRLVPREVEGAQSRDFPSVSELPVRNELPDPLVLLNGERVTTRGQWFEKRRPELKRLFQHYMYGSLLPKQKITAKVERVNPTLLDGKATLKEVTISFGPSGSQAVCCSAGIPACRLEARATHGPAPNIHLMLIVPNGRKSAAPVFLGVNFCGNHALVSDPQVRIPTAWIYDRYPGVKNNLATEEGRATQLDVWAIDQIISRGYAVATFYSGDVDPDRKDVAEGIHQHLSEPRASASGRPVSAHDRGTIAAWAWGLHRAIDYLVRDKDLDRRRIAVVGHSRLGKTALLAAALDERIALSIPHQAGCGGTAPSRGKIGESVRRINESFPHWFNATFKEFNDRPERLPFDQHCLVALVAPRPVLFTNAVEDTWANPEGQFEVLRAADPVYRFLRVEGLGAAQMPEPGRLLNSRLGYFIRPGKHSMTREDWKVFLDFADKHLTGKTSPLSPLLKGEGN